MDEKHKGQFSDELADALADMYLKRWKPDPAPTWVTCVPSRNHPKLVPDFAKQVAARIGLPFIEVVTKVKDNAPQKFQQNRFHQCQNLDGAFEVANVEPGPVLLMDDVIHSGWTITVLAALLQQSGSGPVYPMALATYGTD
jgi:ATP-dependent DNA helicase RecQ